MPSAVAIYYITFLEPNTTYDFTGKFPDTTDSFQSSLIFYHIKGDPLLDSNGNPKGLYLESDQGQPVNYEFTYDQESIVLLCFYLNRQIYNGVPRDWLLPRV